MVEYERRVVSQALGGSPTILVIADDVILCPVLVEALHLEFECGIHLASNGRCAREVVTRSKPDLLLLDDQLTDTNLLDLSDQLHGIKGRERIPTIFLDWCCVAWSERKGYPITSLRKPFTLDSLYAVVNQALTASEEWVGSLSAYRAINRETLTHRSRV